MKLVPKLLPALVLGGAGALALGYPAAAAPASPTSAIAGHDHPVPRTITPRTPLLFSVISSDVVSSSQTQVRVTVNCPKGTVPFGGGVFTSSGSIEVNVNDSFPSSTGWVGDLNNSSGATTNAAAGVLCGPKPAHYKLVQGKTVKNPSGSHIVATATCPSGSKPLGGGASATSNSVFTNLASTFPQGRSWRVDENNASAGGDKVTPFAICGSVPRYHVVIGPAQTLRAGTQTETIADCPPNLVPIGGGGFASTSSVGVNINETAFGGLMNDWINFVNNNSGVDFTGSSVVICAAFQQAVT